jgi:hypothetical protein
MSDQQQDPQEPKRRRFLRRTRERIQEFEKSNETFRGLVEHFENHRETYLTGAGCLVVGLVVGGAVRRPHKFNVETVVNIAQDAPQVPEDTLGDACLLIADHVSDRLAETGDVALVLEDGRLINLIEWAHPANRKWADLVYGNAS